MTTYKQVKDVLARIRYVHQQLRDLLEENRTRFTDTRADYFLTLLRKEEQGLQLAVGKYAPHADEGILDTWLQYLPDDDVWATLEATEFSRDMSAEQIVETKCRFDQALVDLYDHLAQYTSASKVQELFRSLKEEKETMQRESSWRLREFQPDSSPPQP